MGDGNPSRVQGQSSGGDLKANPLETRYVQTVCSSQMLFYAGLLLSLSSILQCRQKITSNLHESHDPTRPGTLGMCPPMATLLVRNKLAGSSEVDFEGDRHSCRSLWR